MTEGYLNLDKYIVASDLHKREWAGAWRVAIGMQEWSVQPNLATPTSTPTSSSIINLNPNNKLYHPRQKYLLTAKGISLYNELTKRE